GFGELSTALHGLALPKPEWDGTLSAIFPASAREAATQLLKEVGLFRAVRSAVLKTFKGIDTADVGQILKAIASWKSKSLTNPSLDSLSRLAECAQRVSGYLEDARAFSGIGSEAGVPPAQTMDGLS